MAGSGSGSMEEAHHQKQKPVNREAMTHGSQEASKQKHGSMEAHQKHPLQEIFVLVGEVSCIGWCLWFWYQWC